MGVICYDSEITSAIPAGKLFKAFVLDSDNLIPKLMPQAIKSVELVSGNGGPGSIKQINFGEGSQLKCVKHRIDGIDTEKLTYSYTLIEGDILKDKIESISYEVKIESSSDGGSICKSTSKYHTIGDYDIKEDEIKAGKDKATGLFKAVEAYLLANPDAYN